MDVKISSISSYVLSNCMKKSFFPIPSIRSSQYQALNRPTWAKCSFLYCSLWQEGSHFSVQGTSESYRLREWKSGTFPKEYQGALIRKWDKSCEGTQNICLLLTVRKMVFKSRRENWIQKRTFRRKEVKIKYHLS